MAGAHLTTRCSILIPAYNAARFIRAAVESALNQTYPELEVIVVDDGSTDETSAILTEYGSRIIRIRQENKGPGAARNLGLTRASGELIAMLDADDIWMPHRLDRLVAELRHRGDLGFVTSDAFIMYNEERSNDTYYGSYLPPGWRFHVDDQAYWIMQYNYVFTMSVVRRELFERHGVYDETLRTCEDWDLWARFLTEGERVGLVDEPLGYYRVREGSLTRDLDGLAHDARVMLERAHERPAVRQIPGVTGTLFYARGMEALSKGDRRSAALWLDAARQDPALSSNRRLRATIALRSPTVWNLLRRWRDRTRRGTHP